MERQSIDVTERLNDPNYSSVIREGVELLFTSFFDSIKDSSLATIDLPLQFSWNKTFRTIKNIEISIAVSTISDFEKQFSGTMVSHFKEDSSKKEMPAENSAKGDISSFCSYVMNNLSDVQRFDWSQAVEDSGLRPGSTNCIVEETPMVCSNEHDVESFEQFIVEETPMICSKSVERFAPQIRQKQNMRHRTRQRGNRIVKRFHQQKIRDIHVHARTDQSISDLKSILFELDIHSIDIGKLGDGIFGITPNVRYCVYAPPNSGKSTSVYLWKKMGYSVFDTDQLTDGRLYVLRSDVVLTNRPDLFMALQKSGVSGLAIIPEESVFKTRCEGRGLVVLPSWYSDVLKILELKGSRTVVFCNEFVSTVLLNVESILNWPDGTLEQRLMKD